VKRAIFPVLLILFFLFSGMAKASQENRVFLWSVNGVKGTVYLLGSIHVLKPDSYPLDKRIEDAYAGSRRVMFEADPKEMGSKEVQKALLAQGTYMDKTFLRDHVSEKTYALLTRKLRSAGLPESQFDKYKPWLCAVTLSGVELSRLGFDPKSGIDAHFYALGVKDHKEMIFLETAFTQLELLSRTPASRQEDLLKQSLRELEVIGKRYLEIRGAWKRGDAGKMEGITSMSLKEFPEVKDALFTRRNARWILRVEELMNKDGDSLVIVGAGHLVGEDGILALLRNKGYILTQQ
jgi:uncharacterized protein